MIRGLTLRHPWAFAFRHLAKEVENRTWRPERMGGQVGMYLALHGGAAPRASDDDYLEEIAHALEWMQDRDLITPGSLPDFGHYYQPVMMRGVNPQPTVENTAEFCLSGIVAVARLAEVCTDSPSPWAATGQVHWCLADLVTLPQPVPHRGAQGLWELEPAALAQVRNLYRIGRAG